MAHASVDYHMDFISLLSLSNIGVPEPEVAMVKQQQHRREVPANGEGTPVASQLNGFAHSQGAPCHGNGVAPHLANGLLGRGVKRGREFGAINGELEALAQEQLFQDLSKRNCLESATSPEARFRPHPHLGVPQAHQECSYSYLVAQDTVAQDTGIPVQAEQEMEQEVGTRQTNGFTEGVSYCSCGLKGTRRAQFCTGLIEQFMSAELNQSALPHYPANECRQCQSGQSGHLEHLQACKSSLMDTS